MTRVVYQKSGKSANFERYSITIGVGSPFDANGLSDAQTTGAGYYYINLTPSSLQEVPEPTALTATAIGLAALSTRRRAL
jgi:hypothetical protein